MREIEKLKVEGYNKVRLITEANEKIVIINTEIKKLQSELYNIELSIQSLEK